MSESIFLVFDSWSGHRISFINQIRKRFSNQKISIEILFFVDSNHDVVPPENDGVQALSFSSRWHLLEYLSHRQRVLPKNQIIFMDFDRWIVHVLFFRNLRFRAMIMRPYIQKYSFLGIVKFLLKNFFLTLNIIRHPNKIFRLTVPMQKHFFPKRWVNELPVKMDTNNVFTISKFFAGPRTNYTFLIIGAISKRKGLGDAKELIEKFVQIRSCTATLNVVGLQDSKNEIVSRDERIKVIQLDKYLEESKYFDVLSKTDFLIVFNSNVGSSRTLLEGIALGKIVLTRKLSRHWKNFKSFHKDQLVESTQLIEFLANSNFCEEAASLNQSILQEKFGEEAKFNWLDQLFTLDLEH